MNKRHRHTEVIPLTEMAGSDYGGRGQAEQEMQSSTMLKWLKLTLTFRIRMFHRRTSTQSCLQDGTQYRHHLRLEHGSTDYFPCSTTFVLFLLGSALAACWRSVKTRPWTLRLSFLTSMYQVSYTVASDEGRAVQVVSDRFHSDDAEYDTTVEVWWSVTLHCSVAYCDAS